MSKNLTAASGKQGISVPTTLPKHSVLVNKKLNEQKKGTCLAVSIPRTDAVAIMNQAFEAKFKLLAVVGIADLATRQGFDSFSELEEDRQEALLLQILRLTHSALLSVEAVHKNMDSQIADARGES